LNYWYRLPATYNPAKPGGYPVIMYHHGSGQRGDGSAASGNYDKVTADGPLREVKDGRWQVSGVDRHDAILIGPQTPTSRSGDNHPAHPANGQQSLHTLRDVKARFNVAPDSSFVTGFSMGGKSALRAIVRWPTEFRAVVAVGTEWSADVGLPITNAAGRGAWVFCGLNDSACPKDGSGLPNVEAKVVQALNAVAPGTAQGTYLAQAHTTGYVFNQYGTTATGFHGTNIYSWMMSMVTGTPPEPPPEQLLSRRTDVTVSSCATCTYSGTLAAVNDGVTTSDTTRWIGQKPNLVGSFPYVQFQWPNTVSFTRAIVFSGFQTGYAVPKGHFEASADGVTFTTVGQFDGNTQQQTAPITLTGSGRFLRFVCEPPATDYCRVREVEVYGTAP
ncbi:MAG: hypothetical protein JNG84_01675, partial [Archangium sp.]|nr:hypothetical protein [Archangium sp.]